jgi:TRAP-type C4-dicarboxylate transport system permease small subunit
VGVGLFIAAVRWLSQVGGIIAMVLLAAALLVVCQLVVVRYGLGQSAIWQHEFVTFSLIGATFLGSPYVLLTRGHVNVDLLPLYLGGRMRFTLALLSSVISLAFCVAVAWAGFNLWREALVNNWRAETVWAPPLWIPYLSIPLGMGLLSLQYIADILALLAGRDMPFGIVDEERP